VLLSQGSLDESNFSARHRHLHVRNWSFTAREEHRLRVIKNEVFKKIFGPKMVDVTGRKLFVEDLHEC
jgi:hypothetical protein